MTNELSAKDKLLLRFESNLPSFFHPGIVEYLPELIKYSESILAEELPLSSYRNLEFRKYLLDNVVTEDISQLLFRFPYLSEEVCLEIGELNKLFDEAPNEKEDPNAQINEVVLPNVCPPLASLFLALHRTVVLPITYTMLGGAPFYMNSIQVATYYADMGRGNSNVDFHSDEDSQFTCTVELNKETYKNGAGLVIYPDKQSATPDIGYASIFPGLTCMHSSLPIKQGHRQILVHWFNAFKGED